KIPDIPDEERNDDWDNWPVSDQKLDNLDNSFVISDGFDWSRVSQTMIVTMDTDLVNDHSTSYTYKGSYRYSDQYSRYSRP
ncbi:1003_t:CDS:2, partial [Dentiscutata erythropus]